MKFKSVMVVVLCTLIGAAVGYGLLCYTGWRVYTLAESPVARMAAFTGAVAGVLAGWGALILPPHQGVEVMRRARKLVGTREALRARVKELEALLKEAEVKAVARDLLWAEACERADRAEQLRNAERALFVEVGGPGTWAVLVEKSKHPDHAALWEEYQAALSAYEGGN